MSVEAASGLPDPLNTLRRIAEDPLLPSTVTLQAAHLVADVVVSREERARLDRGLPPSLLHAIRETVSLFPQAGSEAGRQEFDRFLGQQEEPVLAGNSLVKSYSLIETRGDFLDRAVTRFGGSNKAPYVAIGSASVILMEIWLNDILHGPPLDPKIKMDFLGVVGVSYIAGMLDILGRRVFSNRSNELTVLPSQEGRLING